MVFFTEFSPHAISVRQSLVGNRVKVIFSIGYPSKIIYRVIRSIAIYMVYTRLIFRVWNKSLCQ